MTRISRVRWGLVVLVTLGLAVSACGSSGSSGAKSTSSSTGSKPLASKALASATLSGSGSTFQQAFDETVMQQLQTEQPTVTVSYAGGGSGKGQTDLQAGLVQWAGSDSTIKPADLPSYKGTVLYFPTVAAPITVSYNLSGVSKLQLSADTLAQIFSSKVKTWDDAAIKADNPGVRLPSSAIVVVHRADGSGTTSNFTSYLTKAAPATWTVGSDKTVPWPAGQRAENGNAGVAQAVSSTTGAIGYVDFSDAKAANLVFASIKNPSGKYVVPSLASATASLAGVTPKADLTYDPLNATGASAYPITSPTYVLVYKNQTDKAVGAALKAFLDAMLGSGQSLAARVDFAKLPPNILGPARAQVNQIVVPS